MVPYDGDYLASVTRCCCRCGMNSSIGARYPDWSCRDCRTWHGPTECITKEGLPVVEGRTYPEWGEVALAMDGALP